MPGRSFRSSPGRVTDESLLVELASLTPEERLRWNDRMVTAVLELRDGCAPRRRRREASRMAA
jgi:hypothetical protein